MHTSKFRFTLDLHTTQSQISIPITLGDTGRTWYISFSDGSLPFALTDGCLAKLEIKRPTGTFLEEFCAIENETNVRYSFSQNENTAAVEGLHECAVILYDAEGNVIGSPRFTMIVIDRVVSSDDINLSDENRTAIDGMITAEAARQSAEEGRINAEAERIRAEESRANAETARVSTFNDLKQEMETAAENIETPGISVESTEDGYKMTVNDKNGKTEYQLPAIINQGGVAVEANPSAEATEALTRVKIGNKVYSLPAGTGGVTVAEYDGEVVIA